MTQHLRREAVHELALSALVEVVVVDASAIGRRTVHSLLAAVVNVTIHGFVTVILTLQYTFTYVTDITVITLGLSVQRGGAVDPANLLPVI